METEGCYNYPETNTSALCTPRVPLSQPGAGKQMYLIFWERGVWGVGGWRRGVPGGRWREKERGEGWRRWRGEIVKGMERDESRKQGMGEDRDGERRGDNEGKGGGE